MKLYSIGNHVLIETQCHITAYLTVEDYLFMGPSCVTTDDLRTWNDYCMASLIVGVRLECFQRLL